MKRILAFITLALVKSFSQLFFRLETRWLGQSPHDPWKNARLGVFLNHTSLYEPLFLQALSYRFLWRLSGHINVPGADVTLKRPIVGRFWKLMLPNISAVTRKKDASWTGYLKTIRPDSIIMIAPEGRMKRPSGLDKHGRPMTVKGGVADIIEALEEGGMILCLSGGLHHVQSPGQLFPRLFKTIRMNFIYLDLREYKKSLPPTARERKIKIVQDLQRHLEQDCP
jgi:hypothetical protein